MTLNKLTSDALADNTIDSDSIANNSIPIEKLSNVNLAIAPEVLTIDVAAPAAGQDTQWLWNWLTSSLPYARRAITNSNELNVPLYKQGTYTVNNFAKTQYGSMTQAHTMHFKWIDGAGTQNNISWVTDQGTFTDSHPDINGGSDTTVQRLSISVPSTVTPPTLTAPSVTYGISFVNTGAYTFSGPRDGDNPNIGPLRRGGTYTFNVNASGHPFYLTTDNGTNFSAGTYFGEYTSGVTNSRTASGTVTFVVPANAPDTLYYQCGNHSSMRGAITIKDLAVETNINGNYVVYAQHTQEGHKTPVELRPIPSLVNQMCIVYDATTGQFVPQDLATYVENTPSFENKIREVAGTAELVVEDGSAVVAKVNVYADSTYLPLTDNNAGDQAFATDTNKLYIWDGSAWQLAGAANTGELSEGTNLYFTNARADARAQLKIDALVDSSPGTLDTLNELAAALGDDANFSTTITNSIATKLPLAGGTLTGTLTVNTASNSLPSVSLSHSNTNADNFMLTGGVPGTSNAGFSIRDVDATTNRFVIDTLGNIGIGLDAPAKKLHVHSGNSSDIARFANDSGSFTLGKTANLGSLDMAADANFRIRHGSTLSATFKSNGYVGIGTSSPSNQLHLQKSADNGVVIENTTGATLSLLATGAGRVRSSGHLIFDTGGSTEHMRIESSGNVGIGTASPQEMIHAFNPSTSAAIRVSGEGNNNKKAEIGYHASDGPYVKGGSSGITSLKFYVDNTSLALTLASNRNATFAQSVTATSFYGDGSALTGISAGPTLSSYTPTFAWTGTGAIPSGSVWWAIGKYFQLGNLTWFGINAAFFGHSASGELYITTPTTIPSISGSMYPGSFRYSGTLAGNFGSNGFERKSSSTVYPYVQKASGYDGRYAYADTENNGGFRIQMSGWYWS